jgi:hypothetical protein
MNDYINKVLISFDLLSTVRKSKINILCCTQTPHQIGASIHSNSAIKIMFSLANALDADFMFRCIGNLNQEQKEFCFGLKERQIVIKNSLRFQNPILGTIPEIQQFSDVTNEAVSRNNDLILSLLPSIVPRYQPNQETFTDDIRTKPAKEKAKPEKAEQNQAEKPTTKPEFVEADDKIKTFLWSVNLYQYQKTLTEICKLAGSIPSTSTILRGNSPQTISSSSNSTSL